MRSPSRFVRNSLLALALTIWALPVWAQPGAVTNVHVSAGLVQAESIYLGVPDPGFGITDVAPDSATLCTNWPTAATTGCYYIDPGGAGATNSSNTFGYPNKPRTSVPDPIPAGSLIEVHTTNGVIYSTAHNSGGGILTCQGTSATFALGTAGRAWIRGVDNGANRPTMSRPWVVEGDYCTFENMFWDGDQFATVESGFLRFSTAANASYVVFRNIEIDGDSGQASSSALMSAGGGAGVHSYIVWYNNDIHDNGDLAAWLADPDDTDPDAGGIVINRNADHIWVLDTDMYEHTGSCLQINAGNTAGFGITLHHIYVAGNVVHNCLQGGFGVKQSEDVVLSQNQSYDHYDRFNSIDGGSPSKCFGWQYSPSRLWIIGNIGHGCSFGMYGTVAQAGTDPGVATYVAVVGNILYDIRNEGLVYPVWSPDANFQPSAIMMRVSATTETARTSYIVDNLIESSLAGIYLDQNAGTYIVTGNILANRDEAAGHDMNIPATTHTNGTFTNNLIYSPGDFSIRVGSTNYTSLASYQAAFGTQGDNYVTSDPSFVDASTHDYHVTGGSPAIDAGIAQDAMRDDFMTRHGVSIYFDIDDVARPQNGTWDMGPYEDVP